MDTEENKSEEKVVEQVEDERVEEREGSGGRDSEGEPGQEAGEGVE